MPRKKAEKVNKKPRLSPNQIRAAGMLAAGDRYIVVAERCGVDADTLRRWRRSTGFKAKVVEFQQIQAEEVQYAIKSYSQSVVDNLKLAIATCNEIMSATETRRDKYENIVVDEDGRPIVDYKYSANARVNAARTAIATAIKTTPNIEPPDTIEVAAAAEPDFSEERLKDVREKIYGIY